jgi:hypothetical protein
MVLGCVVDTECRDDRKLLRAYLGIRLRLRGASNYRHYKLQLTDSDQ